MSGRRPSRREDAVRLVGDQDFAAAARALGREEEPSAGKPPDKPVGINHSSKPSRRIREPDVLEGLVSQHTRLRRGRRPMQADGLERLRAHDVPTGIQGGRPAPGAPDRSLPPA
jgi:hypothetical protein